MGTSARLAKCDSTIVELRPQIQINLEGMLVHSEFALRGHHPQHWQVGTPTTSALGCLFEATVANHALAALRWSSPSELPPYGWFL
jgi:hypothetical protein